MRPIAFAVVLMLSLFHALLSGEAQQVAKIWRIGFVGGSRSTIGPFIQAFERGLRELGYVDGQNIAIVFLKNEQLPRLTDELVRLKIDVLVAATSQPALAAKNATTTIPIVMVNVAGPVENGLVASLARPGGNVTGLSRSTLDIIDKNLQLLAEAVPSVVRVAVLSNPTHPLHPTLLKSAKRAAESLKLQLKTVEAGAPNELEGAFSAIARERVSALLVLADGMFWAERTRIANLALKHQLPSMFGNTEHAEAGGLMSYAPSSVEPYRRAASYVDKILKGAKPADLPVEQPTKFELVINLKTARALGLTIPQTLLLRADQLIE